ncbi:MAG: hypothetical protein AAGK22_19975, partial [Acidobacteriota bacterium]
EGDAVPIVERAPCRRSARAAQTPSSIEKKGAQGFAHSVLAEPRRRWHRIDSLGIDKNRERRSLR